MWGGGYGPPWGMPPHEGCPPHSDGWLRSEAPESLWSIRWSMCLINHWGVRGGGHLRDKFVQRRLVTARWSRDPSARPRARQPLKCRERARDVESAEQVAWAAASGESGSTEPLWSPQLGFYIHFPALIYPLIHPLILYSVRSDRLLTLMIFNETKSFKNETDHLILHF